MRHLDAVENICDEFGMTDLVVSVYGIRGLAQRALGRVEEAVASTRKAVAHVHPGVDHAYLISFWHYQTLQDLGHVREARAALGRAHQQLMHHLRELTSEERRMALQRVPEHRAIVQAWESTLPCRASFRIPQAGVPTGRPLSNKEWVEVLWTIDALDDQHVVGRVARRRHRPLRLVGEAAVQGGAPTVNDLANALDASRATICRDLAFLRRAGCEIRTRGSRSPRQVAASHSG